jgi:hypothetical protein
MASHQYLCPECGVALQSAQDVAGRSVRCLGCQAVFTARSGHTTQKPKASRHEAKTSRAPARRERNEDDRLELPPIPRQRKLSAGMFVFGAFIVLAMGASIVLLVRYKSRKTDPVSTTVVKNETATPANTSTPAGVKPGIDSKPAEVLSTGRREEEEDTTAVPTKGPEKPVSPPDLSNILPKLPGVAPKDPPTSAPPPNTPKPMEPVAPKPTEPVTAKPADPVEPPTRADGLIPAALLTKLKAATVFIKMTAGSVQSTGSGFVLRVEGNNALVVTNNHVISPSAKDGQVGDPHYEVVFHSGR